MNRTSILVVHSGLCYRYRTRWYGNLWGKCPQLFTAIAIIPCSLGTKLTAKYVLISCSNAYFPPYLRLFISKSPLCSRIASGSRLIRMKYKIHPIMSSAASVYWESNSCNRSKKRSLLLCHICKRFTAPKWLQSPHKRKFTTVRTWLPWSAALEVAGMIHQCQQICFQ